MTWHDALSFFLDSPQKGAVWENVVWALRASGASLASGYGAVRCCTYTATARQRHHRAMARMDFQKKDILESIISEKSSRVPLFILATRGLP